MQTELAFYDKYREGRAKGRKEGRQEGRMSLIKKLGQALPAEKIAELLDIPLESVNKILAS